jgi:hypothetical protein
MLPFFDRDGFRVSRFIAAGMFVLAYLLGYTDGWMVMIATLTLADWRVKL